MLESAARSVGKLGEQIEEYEIYLLDKPCYNKFIGSS